jgi:hypothetical protein
MSDQLATLLTEERRFAPPAEFVATAAGTPALYEAAKQDRLAFWEEQARTLEWMGPWRTVLEWQPPHAKWFVGGQLNVSAFVILKEGNTPSLELGRRQSAGRRGRQPHPPAVL